MCKLRKHARLVPCDASLAFSGYVVLPQKPVGSITLDELDLKTTPSYARDRIERYLAWFNSYLMAERNTKLQFQHATPKPFLHCA